MIEYYTIHYTLHYTIKHFINTSNLFIIPHQVVYIPLKELDMYLMYESCIIIWNLINLYVLVLLVGTSKLLKVWETQWIQ